MAEGCQFVASPFKPSHCKLCFMPKVDHKISSVANKPTAAVVSPVKPDLKPISSTVEETKVVKTNQEMQQEIEREEEDRKAKLAKLLDEKERKGKEEAAERQRKLDEQARLEEERRKQQKEELAEKQRIAHQQAEQQRLQEREAAEERRRSQGIVEEVVEEVVEVMSLPPPSQHSQGDSSYKPSSPRSPRNDFNQAVTSPRNDFSQPAFSPRNEGTGEAVINEPVDEIAREEAYLDNLMKIKQKKFENKLHGGLDAYQKKEEMKAHREEEELRRKDEEVTKPPPVRNPNPPTSYTQPDASYNDNQIRPKKIPIGGVMMQGFNPMALAEESKKKLAALREKRGLDNGEQEAQSGTGKEVEEVKWENPSDYAPQAKYGPPQGINLFGSGAFQDKLALRKSKLDAADTDNV